MKIYKRILLVALLFTSTIGMNAQEIGTFMHKIVVGYHFGATLPMPIPREVRAINGYWPQFTPQLGYNVSYQFKEKWAVESGITLDWKGMGARDRVKYMYTDVMMDGDNIKGYFTGKNETRVKMSYVTVPIRLAYSLTPDWKLKIGGFFSYRNSSEFSGTVWDGYLRETGNSEDKNIAASTKINIPNKDEAVFDFGKDMRNFDMGVSIGAEYHFVGRFGIYGDLTYSITPIFPSSFKGIDFEMRSLYLVIGASYKL